MTRTATAADEPPAATELKAVLGGAHAAFAALTAALDGSKAEWKRYGKNSPWALKVSRRERTLFYVVPGKGAFEVTVVLGARATEAALAGAVSPRLHPRILAARAYAEGRPVRVTVTSEADLAGVHELLAAKLSRS